MSTLHQVFLIIAFVWALVTAALVFAVTYKRTLESRENDQIYLDPAERRLVYQQQSIFKRVERFTWPIRILFASSGLLLLATGALWLWEEFNL